MQQTIGRNKGEGTSLLPTKRSLKPMNVYKINNLYIAAKDADSALGCYIDETDGMSDIFLGKMKKGMSIRLRSQSSA
ncbi:hypothetical protein [Paenibacillus larvae]|uniref:hypothetical protein n=1 Tax=Paenibacillus larvae TaxID=1464 RepID=UPI0028539F12|nr:hypothetical protein [Paenibacillus larvae]MDR5600594.1 hypothetical protein [Paenibacillus larvae]